MYELPTSIDAPPNWAPPSPPTPQAPPVLPSTIVTARRSPRQRWPRLAATSVAVAAIVGGGAGYAGATLADHHSTTTPTTSAATLAFTTGQFDVASLVKHVEPSVVTIRTQITVSQGPRSYTGEAAGTGIVLTANGEILTNAHVVADATSITVTLHGETVARQAVLIGKDTTNDVALIKVVGASGLTPAKLGDSNTVAVGDDVVAIGNALDLQGGVTVTRGIISALNRSIDVESGHLSGLLQTDAAISSGNSGGPLVNRLGEIIGMNSAGATSSGSVTAENIGFTITINQAMKIVAQLRAAA
jgi:putative serine protease PepD